MEGNIIIKRNTEGMKIKGYYTVEAAVFLPLFILALLTIGYFIKIYGCSENVMHSAADESRRLASLAYDIKISPGLESRLEERISLENPDISWTDVDRFRYLHEKNGIHGLISFDVDYRMNVDFPLGLRNGFSGKEKIRCRGFIGAVRDADPISFADMEKDKRSLAVWVFPWSGRRYHKETCTHISSYPKQMMLNDDIRSRYSPCALCHPEKLGNGNFVYCFTRSGYAYHRGSCRLVDKYIVSMEKYQAEKRGYTPCLKCGGN